MNACEMRGTTTAWQMWAPPESVGDCINIQKPTTPSTTEKHLPGIGQLRQAGLMFTSEPWGEGA